MALDGDDEILQDFLVEAAEILELLNEQLVELEQRAGDSELLNSIFRGFHTIKGGAGFLNLTHLVSICHRSEDIFNLLRNGEKELTASMMDRFLQVLDVLNAQFENMKRLEEPEAAPAELLVALEAMNHPGNTDEATAAAAPVAAAIPSPAPAITPIDDKVGGGSDITDDEFETLLDALETPEVMVEIGGATPSVSTSALADDEISEDEFDALLDQIHGEGKFGVLDTPVVEPVATSSSSDSDDISEDEFDALLDQLHGKGQFKPISDGATPPPAKPAVTPAPVSKPEAVTPPPPPPASRPVTAEAPSAPDVRKKSEVTPAETTVRVDTKRLDMIMNMVGELVLVRNRLSVLSNAAGSGSVESMEEIQKVVSNLDVVTGDLQTSVMKTRMQPIKKVFGRFPRVVRDLARSLKKDVNLEMFGEETDLDKNLVEALADPLVHLVRNSVDHGVEMPDVREKAGKSRRGTVTLSADQEGDHILLRIDDDGAGMNPDILRGIAVKKGLMDAEAAARLSNKECYMLIFAPGFSTKEQISDISGRGVGMDVVKTRIAQLNGTVEIDSTLGVGTSVSIKVPLTLAIMPTLVIQLQTQTFALPLVSVNEIFHLEHNKTNVVDGRRVVMIRNKALPLYYLSSWLTAEAPGVELPDHGYVVVVNVGTILVGFVVDHLIGQEEVVIKPLGFMLQGTPGMAGATITGDGNIALILDVPGLMKAYT